MVTLYDVARLARVSTATVSRVVHGQDRVRETTRARVQQAIEELGYVPDGAAQSLSRRRKDVIGLVYVEREPEQIDIENEGLLYYDEVLRGVESRIRDREWSLLIAFMQAEGDDPPAISRLDALSGKVDGLLIGEGFVAHRHIERLAARIPVVVIAGTPGERAADVVAADNFSGSAAITRHLVVEHGRRRLVYLDGPPDSPDSGQRRLALDQVLREHPDCRLIGTARGNFSVRSGEQAGAELIASCGAERPDAVVAANDQMAIGAMRAFAAAGLRVPEDVAVVGFDDIYPARLVEPALTTVRQPMRMLGERACARLLERIASPGLSPGVELLPTELVLRASCGCPPGAMTRRPVAAASADSWPASLAASWPAPLAASWPASRAASWPASRAASLPTQPPRT